MIKIRLAIGVKWFILGILILDLRLLMRRLLRNA